METLQRLADLGFANATLLEERPDVSLVRIRTSKGWAYERFKSAGDVDRWATLHKPEMAQ